MAVIVSCKCGKKFKARDELAGRTISCPGCGAALQIPASAPPAMAMAAPEPVRRAPMSAPVAPARQGPAPMMYPGRRITSRPEERATRFSISPKMMVWFALLLIVPTLVILAKFGPMRAWQQWTEREGIIKQDINDAIEVYMRKSMPPLPPGVIVHERDLPKLHTLIIDEPIMPMTFPSKLDFQGRSSFGDVRGVYYTETRKTVATVGSHKVSATSKDSGPEFDK